MSLEEFVLRFQDFNKISASSKIDLFIYYHTVDQGKDGVSKQDVDSCFEKLKINKYSNISQYLRQGATKSKGKPSRFILQKGLYHLERSNKIEIDELIKAPQPILITNNYFPFEIFDNTRGYLKSIATQAIACYDQGLYDASSVMTRKLLEVLIIEAFERHKIADKVKNDKGNFFYLSDLIDIFKSEHIWNIGRNAKNSLPSLKKMGDLSAHNRRFIARQPDIDKIKDDLRIVLEELIHLIDYPSWNK
jgi:hypothetical protein